MFGRKRKPAPDDEPARFRFGDPLYPDYSMRFGKQASAYEKRLWPESGPATTVQGELFRAVEKLWFEGQDNGNINWGADFEIFLDLLATHLLADGVLDQTCCVVFADGHPDPIPYSPPAGFGH